MASDGAIIVGISDCAVGKDPANIVTYALGSCVAVCVFDPVTKVGGLLHYLLPDSQRDPAKAANNPFMFADTGIPELMRRTMAAGAERRRLKVTAAGGASVVKNSDAFQIGHKNVLALRKTLWRVGAVLSWESLGGEMVRTVTLQLATGETKVRELPCSQ